MNVIDQGNELLTKCRFRTKLHLKANWHYWRLSKKVGSFRSRGAAVQFTDNLCKWTARAPTHCLLFHFPHMWQLFQSPLTWDWLPLAPRNTQQTSLTSTFSLSSELQLCTWKSLRLFAMLLLFSSFGECCLSAFCLLFLEVSFLNSEVHDDGLLLPLILPSCFTSCFGWRWNDFVKKRQLKVVRKFKSCWSWAENSRCSTKRPSSSNGHKSNNTYMHR